MRMEQMKTIWKCITNNSIRGEPSDIDPDCVSHDNYLTEFKSMLITILRSAIDADIENDPDCTKGRKKTVQVSWIKNM